VYAGSIVVGTATVQDLAPNAFAGVSLTWNTSAVEPGSYQLRVEAAALRNETDLGDNTLVGETIEIHPLIEAMASANPIDTDVGMAVAFTCSKTDWSTPFGPYEFAWDFGDGGTAAGDTATHRYGASGTMTATCSVVDASGGNATASVEVAVYALPSVTAIADRTSAEPGTPITFTATPTGGSGGFSYNWGFGDRSSGDGAVVAHTYTDAGQYTAIVTTRDSAAGDAGRPSVPAGRSSLGRRDGGWRAVPPLIAMAAVEPGPWARDSPPRTHPPDARPRRWFPAVSRGPYPATVFVRSGAGA